MTYLSLPVRTLLKKYVDDTVPRIMDHEMIFDTLSPPTRRSITMFRTLLRITDLSASCEGVSGLVDNGRSGPGVVQGSWLRQPPRHAKVKEPLHEKRSPDSETRQGEKREGVGRSLWIADGGD